MIDSMDMEYANIIQDKSTKDIGRKIKDKELEKNSGLMEVLTKVNIKMISLMDMGN